jgi:hypothetical protein
MGYGPALSDSFSVTDTEGTWYGSALSGPLAVTFVPDPPEPAPRCAQRQGPLGWLVLDGLEIGNEARVVDYLSNRFSAANPTGIPNISSSWKLSGCDCVCDSLRSDDDGNPLTFATPETDAAPWYSADVPASAEFLGVMITEIDGLDSLVKRAVLPRGAAPGGASLGPETLGVRELTFEALLIATSCPGMEYGRRWLTHALANQGCASCATRDARLRLGCPHSEDEFGGRPVTLGRVGLVEGPTRLDTPESSRFCDFATVTWKMVAEDPWILTDEVECLPETAAADMEFGEGTLAACCIVEPAAPFGVTAPIVRFKTGDVGGSGSGDVIPTIAIDFVPVSEEAEGCELDDTFGNPVGKGGMTFEDVPNDAELIIDAASRTARIRVGNGDWEDAFQYLVLAPGEGVRWPEVCRGERLCVCGSFQSVDFAPESGSLEITYRTRYLA